MYLKGASMSPITDVDEVIDRILKPCLELLANERLPNNDSWELADRRSGLRINYEWFGEHKSRIVSRLSELLKAHSKNQYTVIEVDQSATTHPIGRAVYFVRVRAGTNVAQPLVTLEDDMVLCEINPYTSQLRIRIAFSPAVQDREEDRLCWMRINDEHNSVLARLAFCVEQANNEEVWTAWNAFQAQRRVKRSHVDLIDLLKLCDVLGVRLTLTRP